MKFDTVESNWLILDEVDSTQRVAAELVKRGDTSVSVVMAHHQSKGRGRFDRVWTSERGASLTVSLIFHECGFHAKPWLLGMFVAASAARTLDCRVQWPNDLLLMGKKVGGILTEIFPAPKGKRVPVVGLGINVLPGSVPPDLGDRATCLGEGEPAEVLRRVLAGLNSADIPETWPDISAFWTARDSTPGKEYRLANGHAVSAVRVGGEGQLVALDGGKEISVYAADAIFGRRAAPV